MASINYIRIAKKAAQIEISELKKINKIFNKSFIKSVELISECKGKVIAAGIGKSGIIARKVSATLSSIGISSFYLNPGEANHGDLGQIEKKDILLVFSYSGNTSEIANMLKYANRFNIKVIGVASKKDSLLLKASDVSIVLPQVKEADPTGMVPTTSTSITLLFGDCLAVALMNKIKFSKDKFKIFHPGGNIGQTLLLVRDIMIVGNKLPVININKNIADAIKVINNKKLGLVVILKNKAIKGILTDGDARRSIKHFSKNEKIDKFMTLNPLFVTENTPASKALSIMNEKKITSLLVVSDNNLNKKNLRLKGIIHIHSLLKFGIK
jgi:arabinose-5-phosphate isomerase|tara:strand:- start:27 stop:1004 length:978 start_codon:yes stop_codon:yes gene_type:complete